MELGSVAESPKKLKVAPEPVEPEAGRGHPEPEPLGMAGMEGIAYQPQCEPHTHYHTSKKRGRSLGGNVEKVFSEAVG